MEQHKVNIAVMTKMTMKCMQACGLKSVVDYFDVKTHSNVTTRREI